MRVGVIRTVGSPCRCGEAVSKALEALGHECHLYDSEDIESCASEIAGSCDLVIDHTDTFRGRSLYRALVRLLLEAHGTRVVGSDAKTCFLADNKIAVKDRLAGAGIPSPPGVAVHSKTWQLPPWLRPPLVIKPAFEHMSRGVRVVRTDKEAYTVAAELLDSFNQPILVESYIHGRELAVSLLAGPGGLQVLPPVEWRMETTGPDFLTEGSKLVTRDDERRDVSKPDLPADLYSEMETMVRRAFDLLGLRDYARFDLKLSPGGTIFMLEANTTPSLEPFEALPLSARWAGLNYTDLVEQMLFAALRRQEGLHSEKEKEIRVDLPTGEIRLRVPEGVHVPAPSSIELARLLDVRPGEDVLDMGCGSGLLSIAAAKLGARRVVAVDLDPRALEATAYNAARNGVGRQIDSRAGSWFEALDREERFDVIIANPPQTPGPLPFGPKYGGPDGTNHLFKVIAGAAAFLKPLRGRLWMMAISLANPTALRKRLEDCFSKVCFIHNTDRTFTKKEYEALDGRLFDYFLSLRASGLSEFAEREDGSYVFRNLFIRATGARHR